MSSNWSDPQNINEKVDKVKQLFSTRTWFVISILVLIILGGWIFFTGLYTVAADEVAVIQRFGKYVRQEGPGLHFKWPEGIEHKTNVKVKKVFREEFGYRTLKAGVETQYSDESRYLDESLMLTGDLNCAVVPWLVQYRIKDPVNFLFRVRNVRETLRYLSEAIVREVLGDRSINEVITARLEIADAVKVKLQKAVDDAKCGINIVNIELKNTTVPDPVKPSFNEVNQALQEKERMIYEARRAYNKEIPKVRGEADKMVNQAEGYSSERINHARGDSSRFVAVYNEYRKAPDVTRRRLYLETMNKIMPKLGSKYIIDSEVKNTLPLLNMNGKGGVK